MSKLVVGYNIRINSERESEEGIRRRREALSEVAKITFELQKIYWEENLCDRGQRIFQIGEN